MITVKSDQQVGYYRKKWLSEASRQNISFFTKFFANSGLLSAICLIGIKLEEFKSSTGLILVVNYNLPLF